MNKNIKFGLVTLINSTAIANINTSDSINSKPPTAEKISAEIILQLTQEQSEQLIEVLKDLKIEIKDWQSVEVRELPSRCC